MGGFSATYINTGRKGGPVANAQRQYVGQATRCGEAEDVGKGL